MLAPSAQIVLVAVTSAHRGQAFQACEFLMDYLKTQAPFWKKEAGPEGARWVDARVADDAALARWGIAAGNAADRPAARRRSAERALARYRAPSRAGAVVGSLLRWGCRHLAERALGRLSARHAVRQLRRRPR